TKCARDSVNFTTAASGSGPFSYLWRKGTAILPGETNNSFTIPTLMPSDAGIYSVEVHGSCASVTNSAVLAIYPDTASTPLSDSTNCQGETVTFSTVASGAGPFSYQWLHDGVPLTDRTNSSVTVSNITPAN